MNTRDFPKQPSEIERIGVSFKPGIRMAATGEYVATATYVITDPDDVDVTSAMKVAASELISDEDGDSVNETASIRVQGGDDAKDYRLSIKATTSLGNVLEQDRFILVREKLVAV